MKKSIAVIGQGFVGGSLTTVFSERGFDVYAYDKSGKYVKGASPRNSDASAGYPGSVAELIRDNEGGATPGFSGVYFVCVFLLSYVRRRIGRSENSREHTS